MTDTRFHLDIDVRHLGVRETIKRVLLQAGNLGPQNIEDALVELFDVVALSPNPAKVNGYTAQPEAKVDLVNSFKEHEERLLRTLDALEAGPKTVPLYHGEPSLPGEWVEVTVSGVAVDKRWLAIARTDFQRAYMALNRAVFQPQRVRLPEDDE